MSNDNEKIPALHEMDVEAALNIRDWIQKAIEAQGGKFVGEGVGLGGSDLDIEVEGCAFNIFIKPRLKS